MCVYIHVHLLSLFLKSRVLTFTSTPTVPMPCIVPPIHGCDFYGELCLRLSSSLEWPVGCDLWCCQCAKPCQDSGRGGFCFPLVAWVQRQYFLCFSCLGPQGTRSFPFWPVVFSIVCLRAQTWIHSGLDERRKLRMVAHWVKNSPSPVLANTLLHVVYLNLSPRRLLCTLY